LEVIFFFILHSGSAIINRASDLVIGAPKPDRVPEPPVLHVNHWAA